MYIINKNVTLLGQNKQINKNRVVIMIGTCLLERSDPKKKSYFPGKESKQKLSTS